MRLVLAQFLLVCYGASGSPLSFTYEQVVQNTTNAHIEAVTDGVDLENNATLEGHTSVENDSVSTDSTPTEFTESTSSSEIVTNSTAVFNETSEEKYRVEDATNSLFNVWIIAGISALVIIIVLLIVLGFVLYHHFSWNRPQTLSDKFSNDESTGYIDDTAFRENSEEMYSLDNDSFLNSLEAMTIQNYWTDHVKHTKL